MTTTETMNQSELLKKIDALLPATAALPPVAEDVRWAVNTLTGKTDSRDAKLSAIFTRLAKRTPAHQELVLLAISDLLQKKEK